MCIRDRDPADVPGADPSQEPRASRSNIEASCAARQSLQTAGWLVQGGRVVSWVRVPGAGVR
eukprot:8132950-Alexandrium_andersonii.AAC.1